MGRASNGASPSQGRILAIDDTPANLAAFGVVLGPLGHRVDLATSGMQGLRLARETPYDLVLLDLRMPVMDGLETARRFREQGFPGPILLMTAFEFSADELRDLKTLEPVDFAAGLIRPELLCAKVSGWLTLQISLRTWKALAQELALENERLRGMLQAQP